MSNLNLTLSNLIGSRICHDPISPIGANNNSLELIEFKGGQIGSEMGLIEDELRSSHRAHSVFPHCLWHGIRRPDYQQW